MSVDAKACLIAAGLDPEDPAMLSQAEVLLEALHVYAKRNAQYHDNWKRRGRRGRVVRIRERAERLWDQGDWSRETAPGPEPATDDAIDLINFAAFLVRANRGEATRDGEWW